MPGNRVSGKAAIVTGAATRLGREMAIPVFPVGSPRATAAGAGNARFRANLRQVPAVPHPFLVSDEASLFIGRAMIVDDSRTTVPAR